MAYDTEYDDWGTLSGSLAAKIARQRAFEEGRQLLGTDGGEGEDVVYYGVIAEVAAALRLQEAGPSIIGPFSATGRITSNVGFTATQGTLTSDVQAFVGTATWNNAAVAFGHMLTTITDTASDAASYIWRVMVGAAQKFNLDKAGNIAMLVGTLSLGASPPTSGAIRVDAASYANTVLYAKNTSATVLFGLAAAGNATIETANSLDIYNGGEAKWRLSSGGGAGISQFTALQVTARIIGGSTNGLAIRNNANTRDNFRVLDSGVQAILSDGTYSGALVLSAASAERPAGVYLTAFVAGNSTSLQADAFGTTGAKIVAVYYNQTQFYSALEVANVASGFGTLALMKSGGAVVIGTDPTGSSPLRIGGNVNISAGSYYYWAGRSQIGSPADGVLVLQNNAGADFSRLQFGGTTASFPALKRASATLESVLADDSGYCNFKTKQVDATAAVIAASAVATPAGGSTAARITIGTTTAFGLYIGSGAPSVSAAKGSLYLRSDGSGVNDRTYVNTDGGTTWTALVSVA